MVLVLSSAYATFLYAPVIWDHFCRGPVASSLLGGGLVFVVFGTGDLGATVSGQADISHFGLFQIIMQCIYFLKIQVFCHTKLASFCSKKFSTPNDSLSKLATLAVLVDFGQKLAKFT